MQSWVSGEDKTHETDHLTYTDEIEVGSNLLRTIP